MIKILLFLLSYVQICNCQFSATSYGLKGISYKKKYTDCTLERAIFDYGGGMKDGRDRLDKIAEDNSIFKFIKKVECNAPYTYILFDENHTPLGLRSLTIGIGIDKKLFESINYFCLNDHDLPYSDKTGNSLMNSCKTNKNCEFGIDELGIDEDSLEDDSYLILGEQMANLEDKYNDEYGEFDLLNVGTKTVLFSVYHQYGEGFKYYGKLFTYVKNGNWPGAVDELVGSGTFANINLAGKFTNRRLLEANILYRANADICTGVVPNFKIAFVVDSSRSITDSEYRTIRKSLRDSSQNGI